MFKLLAVINAILILVTVGGYEHEMFGLSKMFIRIALFLALTAFFALADEVSEERKRAKRMPDRLAHKNN